MGKLLLNAPPRTHCVGTLRFSLCTYIPLPLRLPQTVVLAAIVNAAVQRSVMLVFGVGWVSKIVYVWLWSRTSYCTTVGLQVATPFTESIILSCIDVLRILELGATTVVLL